MSSTDPKALSGKDKRRKRLFWGALTLLPLVLFVFLFVAMWFALSPSQLGTAGGIATDGGSWPCIPIFVVAGSISAVLALGLQAFYVAHAYRRATPGHRWFWIGFVLLGQLFAMPVYWYFYIWKESP